MMKGRNTTPPHDSRSAQVRAFHDFLPPEPWKLCEFLHMCILTLPSPSGSSQAIFCRNGWQPSDDVAGFGQASVSVQLRMGNLQGARVVEEPMRSRNAGLAISRYENAFSHLQT